MMLLGIQLRKQTAMVTGFRPFAMGWMAALILLGLVSASRTQAQSSQTNIITANVTPNSFTVIWRGPVGATPDIRVFADEAGTHSLKGQLGVEAYPLHTGYPGSTNAYEKRLSKAWLKGKTTGYGLQSVRVTGCTPSTTYYFQVLSYTGTSTNVSPQPPALRSVRTADRNTLVPDSVQVLMDVQGLDVAGRIMTLTHSNAVSQLAAVVGDGAQTNQVWFNLADLIALDGSGNFAPNGSLRFIAQVLGSGPDGEKVLPVVVEFTDAFRVARSVLSQVSSDLVALSLGTGVMQGGDTNSVPVSMDSTIPLGSLNITFRVPPGHLTNFVLEAGSPEVDPTKLSLTPAGVGLWSAKIVPRAGQSLIAAPEIVRLKFTALRGVTSAFVPLEFAVVGAIKPDNSAANVALLRAGRMVVVVNEPLLEAHPSPGATRLVTLYGKPQFAYGIESAPSDRGPWTGITTVAMTNLTRQLNLPKNTQALTLYRAFESGSGAPQLQISRRASNQVDVLVFGSIGTNYTLQAVGSLTAPLVWKDVLSFKLTNTFRTIGSIPTTNPGSFYRVVSP